MGAMKRHRRWHVSAFGWATGVALFLGLSDTAALGQEPLPVHIAGLLLIFILAAGFWELVHLLTRDELLGTSGSGGRDRG